MKSPNLFSYLKLSKFTDFGTGDLVIFHDIKDVRYRGLKGFFTKLFGTGDLRIFMNGIFPDLQK